MKVGREEDRVALSRERGVKNSKPLPELARAVQEQVGEALGCVTGLEIERVDVEIAEIG